MLRPILFRSRIGTSLALNKRWAFRALQDEIDYDLLQAPNLPIQIKASPIPPSPGGQQVFMLLGIGS